MIKLIFSHIQKFIFYFFLSCFSFLFLMFIYIHNAWYNSKSIYNFGEVLFSTNSKTKGEKKT